MLQRLKAEEKGKCGILDSQVIFMDNLLVTEKVLWEAGARNGKGVRCKEG